MLSHTLELALLLAIVWTLTAWMAALGCRAALPLLGRVRRLAPAPRADVLLALAGLPALVGTATVALIMLPSVAAFVSPALDHCLDGDHAHAHLCLWHPIGGLTSWAPWLLGALSLPMVWAVASKLREVLAARAAGRALVGVARAPAAGEAGPWVLDVDAPFAGTFGLFLPRVVISRGLLEGCDTAVARVVLAHERAHAARRDGLHRVVASLLAAQQLPATRSALMRELHLAQERACDELAAADAGGDRALVARAILAVERLMGAAAPPWSPALPEGSPGALGASVELRVTALLAEAPRLVPRGHALGWVGVLVSAGIVSALPLHDLVEHLLMPWLAL